MVAMVCYTNSEAASVDDYYNIDYDYQSNSELTVRLYGLHYYETVPVPNMLLLLGVGTAAFAWSRRSRKPA